MNPNIQGAIDEINLRIGNLTSLRDQLITLGLSNEFGTMVAPVAPVPALKTPKARQSKNRSGAVQPISAEREIDTGELVDDPPAPKKSARASQNKPSGLSAMSREMISVGRQIAEPIKAAALAEVASCTMKEASNALVRWKQKGWVSQAGWGKFERTKNFGVREAGVEPAPKAKAPSDSPSPAKAPAQPPLQSDELSPYSAKGIDLGRGLKAEFSVDDLATLLPAGKQAAYYWVSRWRNKGWIEKRDFDLYVKTKSFGL